MSHPSFIDRYKVERVLGAGGMGTVYLATDPSIERKVAIKVLRTDDEEYRRRFKSEIKAAGALRHPNIITIFDSGEWEGAPFLVMEFVPGETLAEKIRRSEPLPLPKKLRYLEDLCVGLAHAHRSGVVHRDIKPANAIVDADSDSVKVVDFGIARVSGATMLTESGQLVGTLNYMSPEQLLGRPLDARTDLYSAGLVLYELLSYRCAFPGGLHDGLMDRILHQPPPDLAAAASGLDAATLAIVSRALEKDPAKRFADAGEMAAALRAARDTQTTRLSGVTPPPAASPAVPDDRQEVLAAPAAAGGSARGGRRTGLVILALIAAALVYGLMSRAPTPKPQSAPAVASGDPLQPSATAPSAGPRVLASFAPLSAAFLGNRRSSPIVGPNGARATLTESSEMQRLDGCSLVLVTRFNLKNDATGDMIVDLEIETTLPLNEIDPSSISAVSKANPFNGAPPSSMAHVLTKSGRLSIVRRKITEIRPAAPGKQNDLPLQDSNEDILARDSATAEQIAQALRASVNECQSVVAPTAPPRQPSMPALQSGQAAPDGTPVVCNFALTIFESLSAESSYRSCGTYTFTTFGAPRQQVHSGWITVGDSQTGKTLEYRFRDMPVSMPGAEQPRLLTYPDGVPTRIVVILRPEEINILVGAQSFRNPPPPLKAAQMRN